MKERSQACPFLWGGLEIRLYKSDPDKPTDKSTVEFRVVVKYSPGGAQERTGDLLPFLTAQEKTQLQAFVESVYNRAVTAIIG